MAKVEDTENGAKVLYTSGDEDTPEGNGIHKTTYELSSSLKEKLEDIPEAMEYVEKLQAIIRKQIKKLCKLRSKIKKFQTPKVDVFTQTSDTNCHTNTVICKEDVKTLAEDIKEAAEMALQNSGFVFEETSGLYYDYNTGYYYNAEYGLYYDGTTGTYLKYNQETQCYDFHSQVDATPFPNQKERDTEKIVGKRKSGHKIKGSPKRPCSADDKCLQTDMEEGECSDSANSSVEDDKSESIDISKQWPPCMRIIVESSDVPKVKVGSLYIITCDGGSLGREGNHSIVIPDLNTSKHHLKFVFDKDKGQYLGIDVGSRNGTLLNNQRMSPSKQESEARIIKHGSKIQIGSTVLLCHIHEGSHTCGHCEPGLIQSSQGAEHKKVNKSTRAQKHKNELKMLKKKCGMVNYEEDPKLASGYRDRAQQRRDTVGSQNPHEKTQVALLDESIPAENKGFKLLSKMGWKEGQSLGKDGTGMLEPIQLVSNKGTAGIGCSEEVAVPVPPTVPSVAKQNIWQKTQERFKNLPATNQTLEESSDD
ncbi:hypothetical protein NQ315_007152 [Exocentrus adspersus]|uniref:Angiogenic factor with G patch and FHA domains 1 n=1 Tax=Exocentrus adspersus TaxID=1586481 RepID=A0AAV8WF53_9CUCU|nr:hypothetical protein NQ315_007152 [Exocentrus adspersus]